MPVSFMYNLNSGLHKIKIVIPSVVSLWNILAQSADFKSIVVGWTKVF